MLITNAGSSGQLIPKFGFHCLSCSEEEYANLITLVVLATSLKVKIAYNDAGSSILTKRIPIGNLINSRILETGLVISSMIFRDFSFNQWIKGSFLVLTS